MNWFLLGMVLFGLSFAGTAVSFCLVCGQSTDPMTDREAEQLMLTTTTLMLLSSTCI